MSVLGSRSIRAAREPRPERPLAPLVRVLLLFESALYSAVTPVLPHYAHTLHASKPAIGVLAAAYSAGLIPGSLLGGWVASHFGVRRTTMVGLVAFGLAVVPFGFGSTIVMLDLLRAVQGVFCGLIWCGGLTWLIYVTPVSRRARTIGGAIGAATLGTVFGPVVGTGAVAVGTGPAFATVGAIALALAVITTRHPEAPHPPESDRRPLTARAQLAGAAGTRGLRLGACVVVLEAATFGAQYALLPLRMSHLGASGLLIGVTFIAGSVLSAVLSPFVGRLTDRRGPRLPITAGLLVSGPLLALLVVPQSPLPLALLMVITLGGPLTFAMIPAASMMTDSAEAAGVTLVLTMTIINLGYALGETIGAPVAASVSAASSDLVPLLGLALLMIATAGAVRLVQPGSASRGIPSSSAAAASDISTYRSGVCSESPSTMCTASPSVKADSRKATVGGSDTDHSPVSDP